MKLTEVKWGQLIAIQEAFPRKVYEPWEEEWNQILKNIEPDKAFEYVMENYYDKVREAVFEQEAENRRE